MNDNQPDPRGRMLEIAKDAMAAREAHIAELYKVIDDCNRQILDQRKNANELLERARTAEKRIKELEEYIELSQIMFED